MGPGSRQVSAQAAVRIPRERYAAAIFDLDGILTRTAGVHAGAWKELFDEFRRAGGGDWKPFDIRRDYLRYVDGKPRYEGVRSFLASRGLVLPKGDPQEPPGMGTLCGLGNRKNEIFHRRLREEGVAVYAAGIGLVKDLRRLGVKTAVVSSSKNCGAVLEAAGIRDLFDERVDGLDLERLGIEGKPAPDIFLETARRLGVDPGAHRGGRGRRVRRAGGPGREIRPGGRCGPRAQRAGVAGRGADVVVKRMSQVKAGGAERGELPSALRSVGKIVKRAGGRQVAVFLDYDGTLTPIVDDPRRALMSDSMRRAVSRLAARCTVAIISGRDLPTCAQRLVGVEDIVYAGSHGFDIAGPEQGRMQMQQGEEFLPVLDRAEADCSRQASRRSGARGGAQKLLDRRPLPQRRARRRRRRSKLIVDTVALRALPELRDLPGKKVLELQPRIDWDKGKALLWMLRALESGRVGGACRSTSATTSPTRTPSRRCENAVSASSSRDDARATAAGYRLQSPGEVHGLLGELASPPDEGRRP